MLKSKLQEEKKRKKKKGMDISRGTQLLRRLITKILIRGI